MSKGKIIVIDGTDCSGKETQATMLVDRLCKDGEQTYYYNFPHYSSPTGQIVGLSYLGKPHMGAELINSHREAVLNRMSQHCKLKHHRELINKAIDLIAEECGVGWFPEGAPNVDPKIASGYYVLDRAYSMGEVKKLLETGNVVMDRYLYSNFGHQGCKFSTLEERKAFYDWDFKLEYEMYEIPHEDIRIFLHVPTIYTAIIKESRAEKLDELERDEEHLKKAEETYLEIAEMYDFDTIYGLHQQSDPIQLSDVKTPEEVHEEVYRKVLQRLK